jgi:hypothetical protein
MKTIPLFGEGIKSFSSLLTSQRYVNVYRDIRTDGDKSQIVLCPTHGLDLILTLPTFPIRGWTVIGNYVFVVAGQYLYIIGPANGYALIGSLKTSTGPVDMAAGSTYLGIVDGQYVYGLNITNFNSLIMSENLSIIQDLQPLLNVSMAIGAS